MKTGTLDKTTTNTQTDFLPLQGTDYVEFYVGNAKQAAHFYMTAFGFQALAYAGPETGIKDRASYHVRQNKLTLLLTTPLRSDNDIADHIYKHGDGVKSLALRVDDATSAWEETTKRGARSYMKPERKKDKDGEVVISGAAVFNETPNRQRASDSVASRIDGATISDIDCAQNGTETLQVLGAIDRETIRRCRSIDRCATANNDCQ